MTHRTEIQLGLLVAGVVVWGYGQRVENDTLTLVGLGLFAAATILRFVKRKPHDFPDDSSPPS